MLSALRALVLTTTLALAPAASATILIDDFGLGDFSMTVSGTANDWDSQSGLPVLGGSRESHVRHFNGPPSSSTTLEVAGGEGTASTTVSAQGFFRFQYDGIPNDAVEVTGGFDIDLTEGGANDRFLIEVTALTGSLDLTIAVSAPGTSVVSVRDISIGAVGSYELLFSEYAGSTDFTSVDTVFIQSTGSSPTGLANNDSISLGRFMVVPEPGSALLLAGGLLGLCFRHRDF